MARWLRILALTMGAACIAIGGYHLLLGIASVPGETMANATVDSRERFYNAIFAGYGLAWILAARAHPISKRAIQLLALVFWLGAAGRLLSLAVHGSPHWFQNVLTVIEIALPPVFLWLAGADERVHVARSAQRQSTHTT